MVSGIVTAILLACFIGGTAWAWSRARREEFDHAARLPLEEAPTQAPPPPAGGAIATEDRP
jgi:cytochrome c oxidase cbb3-type subunit 4